MSIRTRERLTRYALLFLVSVALVAGFWFHGTFYALGLVPLLLVGGLMTFLVLLALLRLATGRPVMGRPRGSLPLPREAVGRALAGTQTVAIVSLGVRIPPAGALTTLRLDRDRPVGRVRIEDIRRCLAEDLAESEAVAAGYKGLEDFRAFWSREGARDMEEILVLVDFHLEAHR